MAKVRSRGTAPELRVASYLSSKSLKFKTNVGELPGRPDIVFFRRKVVVFVHGCFWHGHRGCERAKLPKTNKKTWASKISVNLRRDRRVTLQLRRAGWSVLTVWECKLGPRELDRFYGRLRRKLNAFRAKGEPG